MNRSSLHTPPLLLGAALVFWGWATGFWIVGLLLALVLEGSRVVRWRWEADREQFAQLWNITAMLFLAAIAYVVATRDGLGTVGSFFSARSFTDRSHALDQVAQTTFAFLRWLPMIFFPFAAGQAFSHCSHLDPQVFSWILRRKARRQVQPPRRPGQGVNTAFPYFSLCLASASTLNEGPLLFYGGLSILLVWACWKIRSPRVAWPAWALLATIAVLLGYAGSLGLRALQRGIDDWHVRLLSNVGGGKRDARDAHTAIGEIGQRKGSGQILLRLEISSNSVRPDLLREAVYNLYRWPDWRAAGPQKEFASADPFGPDAWILHHSAATQSLAIAAFLDGGHGPLPLPKGPTRLDRLGTFELRTNQLGTVRAEAGPNFVDYTAHWSDTVEREGPPLHGFDDQVPEIERAALIRIADSLHLAELPEAARVEAVERFFTRHFTYSLVQDASILQSTPATPTPLAHFLLQRRAGHCEYFATATTLLLRQAGVAARYVVGYAVQEHAGGQHYIVRARHAHAWCSWYDSAVGRWREVDTTPGSWAEHEREHRSWLEPITDRFSWLYFQFSRWRNSASGLRRYLFLAPGLALVPLTVRFVRRHRAGRRGNASRTAVESSARPGLDSEFYLLEAHLARRGCGRHPEESWPAWHARVHTQLPIPRAEAQALLRWHQRLRFDPRGLSAEERARLRQAVERWLPQIQG